MNRDVVVLERFYEAFNRGDLEAMLAVLDPEFEGKASFGTDLEGEVFCGHDDVRRWFTELLSEAWSEVSADPERFIEAGDQIVVVVHNVGLGRASGIRIDRRAAHVCRVRGGKITQLYAYPDPAEGFRAAGLSSGG